MPELDKQKMIGEMTQSLMRSLPPEQRKGYFLNLRQFINRQSFIDAVMGTMGITQEELDRQRRKLRLLGQAEVMADDAKVFELLAKQNDADLDYEFFMLLSSMLEQAQAAHDPAAEKLVALRARLLTLTTWGKRIARQEAAVGSLEDVESPADLVEKMSAAEPDEVDVMVVAARPLMDYTFFQALTEKVDGSRGAERDRLRKLRDHLLELTQQMDQAAQETLKAASAVLREMLSSPNPRSAVHEHLAQVDEAFMAVLSLNMQEAERQGAKEVLARLQVIYDEILSKVEEGMPPEVRLINDLLRTPYPDGTRAMLKAHQGQLTPEVLELMDRLIEELSEQEDQDSAKRLRDIKTQAILLV